GCRAGLDRPGYRPDHRKHRTTEEEVMEKRWIIALTATLGLALSLGANAAPDFSGSWVVNNDRGENLPMGGRVKESVTITQTPEKVVMNITASFMGTTMERTVTYDLSGKPVENSGPMGGKA